MWCPPPPRGRGVASPTSNVPELKAEESCRRGKAIRMRMQHPSPPTRPLLTHPHPTRHTATTMLLRKETRRQPGAPNKQQQTRRVSSAVAVLLLLLFTTTTTTTTTHVRTYGRPYPPPRTHDRLCIHLAHDPGMAAPLFVVVVLLPPAAGPSSSNPKPTTTRRAGHQKNTQATALLLLVRLSLPPSRHTRPKATTGGGGRGRSTPPLPDLPLPAPGPRHWYVLHPTHPLPTPYPPAHPLYTHRRLARGARAGPQRQPVALHSRDLGRDGRWETVHGKGRSEARVWLGGGTQTRASCTIDQEGGRSAVLRVPGWRRGGGGGGLHVHSRRGSDDGRKEGAGRGHAGR